jgi:hypothetical protein
LVTGPKFGHGPASLGSRPGSLVAESLIQAALSGVRAVPLPVFTPLYRYFPILYCVTHHSATIACPLFPIAQLSPTRYFLKQDQDLNFLTRFQVRRRTTRAPPGLRPLPPASARSPPRQPPASSFAPPSGRSSASTRLDAPAGLRPVLAPLDPPPSRDLSGQPGSPSQGGPSRPASPPGPSPRQSRQLASPGEPVSRLATGPPPLSAARSIPDHPSASAQHPDPALDNCLGHLDQPTQLSYLARISQPDPGLANRPRPVSPSRAHGRPTDRPGTRPRIVPGPARARTICPSASKTACSLSRFRARFRAASTRT